MHAVAIYRLMSDHQTDFAALGWRCAVDPESEQLHLEHAESDTSYVVDADGNLTVPGGGTVDGTLDDLQATLTSALAGDGGADGHAIAGDDAATQAGSCNIDCDSATGEVTIESDTSITLDAPSIEIDASNQLDLSSGPLLSVSSDGNAEVEADGVLGLEGALIQLN